MLPVELWAEVGRYVFLIVPPCRNWATGQKHCIVDAMCQLNLSAFALAARQGMHTLPHKPDELLKSICASWNRDIANKSEYWDRWYSDSPRKQQLVSSVLAPVILRLWTKQSEAPYEVIGSILAVSMDLKPSLIQELIEGRDHKKLGDKFRILFSSGESRLQREILKRWHRTMANTMWFEGSFTGFIDECVHYVRIFGCCGPWYTSLFQSIFKEVSSSHFATEELLVDRIIEALSVAKNNPTANNEFISILEDKITDLRTAVGNARPEEEYDWSRAEIVRLVTAMEDCAHIMRDQPECS